MCDSLILELIVLINFSFVGDGNWSESRQRSSETSGQNSGGYRPVRHVHTRPVVFHREKGTNTPTLLFIC